MLSLLLLIAFLAALGLAAMRLGAGPVHDDGFRSLLVRALA
jgi:hypothetical protein